MSPVFVGGCQANEDGIFAGAGCGLRRVSPGKGVQAGAVPDRIRKVEPSYAGSRV